MESCGEVRPGTSGGRPWGLTGRRLRGQAVRSALGHLVPRMERTLCPGCLGQSHDASHPGKIHRRSLFLSVLWCG